jgi:hypothetical protein
MMGTPVTSSLIERSAYWRVPLSFVAAVAWVKSHPPHGLTVSGGSAGGNEGSVQIAGVEYSEPDTAVWVGADLEIGIASGTAASSYIRADGVLEVLDPVPLADSASGPRLRVTVAGGCPANQKDIGVSNSGSGLSTSLLPGGAPTAGLVCRYQGSSATPSSSQRLDAAEAAGLAHAVGQAQLTHLDDVMTSCPMDGGSFTVFALSYPGRADVDLWWHSTGCQSIANGVISGNPGDALITFDGAPTQSQLPPQSPGAMQSPPPRPGPISPMPIMKQSPPAA